MKKCTQYGMSFPMSNCDQQPPFDDEPANEMVILKLDDDAKRNLEDSETYTSATGNKSMHNFKQRLWRFIESLTFMTKDFRMRMESDKRYVIPALPINTSSNPWEFMGFHRGDVSRLVLSRVHTTSSDISQFQQTVRTNVEHRRRCLCLRPIAIRKKITSEIWRKTWTVNCLEPWKLLVHPCDTQRVTTPCCTDVRAQVQDDVDDEILSCPRKVLQQFPCYTSVNLQ